MINETIVVFIYIAYRCKMIEYQLRGTRGLQAQMHARGHAIS